MIYNEVKKALEAVFSFVNNALKVYISGSDVHSPVVVELRNQDETVAQEIKADLGHFKTAEVLCKADTATTFTIISSFDGVNEDKTLYQSGVAETEHHQIYTVGAQYLIVKSDAAGAAGDKVTLLVGAKP